MVVEESRNQTPSLSPFGDEDIAEQRLDKGYAIKPGMSSAVFYLSSTMGFSVSHKGALNKVITWKLVFAFCMKKESSILTKVCAKGEGHFVILYAEKGVLRTKLKKFMRAYLFYGNGVNFQNMVLVILSCNGLREGETFSSFSQD